MRKATEQEYRRAVHLHNRHMGKLTERGIRSLTNVALAFFHPEEATTEDFVFLDSQFRIFCSCDEESLR